MRKVISVFAALALVGSLAAQKGKKAAKPAAPAVAVPKAPAIPAVVTAAPAAVGAAKGVGLFIEGRGSFTLSGGSSQSYADGTDSATAQPSALSNASGFGGGASIGYNIVSGLGLVASFDYRSVKSREWAGSNTLNGPIDLNSAVTAGGASSVSAAASQTIKAQNTKNTMIIGVGFRPSVAVGPGQFYAGAGLAILLPYDSKTTVNYSNPSALTNAAASVTGDNTAAYNLAFGGYGELGYQFNITDMIYFGVSGRIVVATSNNDGKDSVTKLTVTAANGNSQTISITSTGKTSPNPAAATSVGQSTTAYTGTSQARYATDGITDLSAVVSVGLRF